MKPPRKAVPFGRSKRDVRPFNEAREPKHGMSATEMQRLMARMSGEAGGYDPMEAKPLMVGRRKNATLG